MKTFVAPASSLLKTSKVVCVGLLAPLKISELAVVDEFKGRKVYRVKPN